MSLEDFDCETVSDTFKALLKTLCLDEYPCKNVKQNNKTIRFNNGKKFLIKDDDEYINRKEDLLDLIKDKSSPWYIHYDWSSEANMIRELYISQVNSINLKNIEQYFKTLRLINKNIKEVDNGLLKFINLNELILNVNWIENCDSNCLPPNLKVLDLGGNQISNLDSLVKRPFQNLEHLGLSYNHLYDLKDYFNPINWPSLVSLDLSMNHLVDLKDLVVTKLKKLEKLKNLVLYGNPICLIPSYRGFIVDSLIQLNYLDDQSISRDERFRFFNMKLYAESIVNEAQVCITVSNLKNIYMPYELKYPETLSEFPVIVYKYVVIFNYVEDKECGDEGEEDNNIQESRIQSGHTSKTSKTKFSSHKQPPVDFDTEMNNLKYTDILRDRFSANKTYTNRIMQTQVCDYNENIQFNEKGILKMKHKSLKPLRDFMMHGLQVNVIEQKLTYDQPNQNEGEDAMSLSPSKKGDNKKKGSAKKDAKKATPGLDNKKKKDQNAFLADLELKSTEDTILASFHLSFDSVLDCSRYRLEHTFKKELTIPEYVVSEFEGNLDVSQGGKGKDKKDAKKGVKQQPPPPAGKGSGKGGKKKTSDAKGITPGAEETAVLTPNVLELNIKFDVLQFQNFEEFRTQLNATQSVSRISKITKTDE